VIVDLAAPQGGNCPLTEPGKTVMKHGVTLVGETNLPALVAPTRRRSMRATCSTSSSSSCPKTAAEDRPGRRHRRGLPGDAGRQAGPSDK
jgi:hypothetical protein